LYPFCIQIIQKASSVHIEGYIQIYISLMISRNSSIEYAPG